MRKNIKRQQRDRILLFERVTDLEGLVGEIEVPDIGSELCCLCA